MNSLTLFPRHNIRRAVWQALNRILFVHTFIKRKMFYALFWLSMIALGLMLWVGVDSVTVEMIRACAGCSGH